MTENIINKLLDFCNGNLIFLIVLVSMLPLLELRISIPFALSAGTNIHPFTIFSIAVSATLIIIPIVLLLLKPIIKLLSKIKIFRKFSSGIENYFSLKAESLNNSVESKNKTKKQIHFFKENRIFFYLFLFVAIPLPLTGYYTGTAIAAFLNLDFYKSFLSIFFGNIVAGLLITFFSSLFENSATLLLILFLAFIFLTIIVKIIKKAFTKSIKN